MADVYSTKQGTCRVDRLRQVVHVGNSFRVVRAHEPGRASTISHGEHAPAWHRPCVLSIEEDHLIVVREVPSWARAALPAWVDTTRPSRYGRSQLQDDGKFVLPGAT